MNPTLSTTITVSFPLRSHFPARPLHLLPLCPHLVLGLLYLSPCNVVWLHFFFSTHAAYAATPSPPPIHFYSLSEPNPQIHQHTQILLTDIWRVSGITRTVLIRTSWHILAKTCTYGNSIRKKGEGGREKK